MLCLIIPLALTIGMAYLLVRTRRFLPPKFRLVRLQAQRVNTAVNQAGATVTGSLASAEAKVTQERCCAVFARREDRHDSRNADPPQPNRAAAVDN
jgi:hypothetical protein